MTEDEKIEEVLDRLDKKLPKLYVGDTVRLTDPWYYSGSNWNGKTDPHPGEELIVSYVAESRNTVGVKHTSGDYFTYRQFVELVKRKDDWDAKK